MIELDRLHKIYNRKSANRVHAVNDVTMRLPDRGMVALFGRSGCGKTTLLNCIGGLDRATEGAVTLDGERITPEANEARNRHVGYIFQNYNLSKTLAVFENVAVSLRLCGVDDEKEIARRVMAALTSVDMEKYRNRLPDALSGGQQQRVAIARAIVKNPKLILADEPTGNLDEQNTVLVMDLLKEISRDHLVLLVTHEADLVDLYCDRVIEMSDGCVTSERENAETVGFSGRSANEIYLGDLQAEREELAGLSFEYFGAPEEKPGKIRLIASGGTLYIKADTALKVKLLDHTAEALVHEGKFEERGRRAAREISPVLLEKLPEGKTGRMYRFGTAVQSGFRANFRGRHRGKKLLIVGLVLFPLIIVSVLASFGRVFRDVKHIHEKYDAATVFVKAEDFSYEDGERYKANGLADFVKNERNAYYTSGGMIPYAQDTFYFSIGNFETFSNDYYSYFSAEGFMRPVGVMGTPRLVCGSAESRGENEIVITSAFADALLEATGVDYIKSYEDLLYTVGKYQMWTSTPAAMTVVGIVEGSERVLYLPEYAYAQNVVTAYYDCERDFFTDVAHSGLTLAPLEKGEIYCTEIALADPAIHAGDSVDFAGRTFTVKAVLSLATEIDPADFLRYVKSEYNGENVFADLSSFSVWWHGFDLTDYGEWDTYYNDGTESWEETLEQLQKTYDREYTACTSRYLATLGKTLPGVILHPDDLLSLTATTDGGRGRDQTKRSPFTVDSFWYGDQWFYSLHGADPAALQAALIAEYGDAAVITPREMYEVFAAEYRAQFIVSGVVIALVAVIMSLCLYFIMRSSLMSDIREIGICRAVGVSRRNLVFRYFVEMLVLFALTIFLGYLAASGALLWLSGAHSVIRQLLYYPVWMALITLGALFGVSVACGLAPICSLLRRTPAEILSKYDI